MKPESDGDFSAFVAARWPQLVRTAYMLTGDFHEAEDLVQTTLVKVCAQWRRVRVAEADVYVRRALVNNNRSRLRKKRVTHLLVPFLPEPAHAGHTGYSGHTETADHRDAIFQALGTLSARQRAVVVLRYWDDMSESDVAEILNCSVGTVKTHARRGLTALRSHPALTSFAGAAR